ncbi:hypothetical protein [Streptomyces sp. NPDC049099]
MEPDAGELFRRNHPRSAVVVERCGSGVAVPGGRTLTTTTTWKA